MHRTIPKTKGTAASSWERLLIMQSWLLAVTKQGLKITTEKSTGENTSLMEGSPQRPPKFTSEALGNNSRLSPHFVAELTPTTIG